jgi:hypothetical protein
VVAPPVLRTGAASPRSVLAGALLLALLAGCGPPPQVEPTPEGPLPGPGTPAVPATPPAGPIPPPTTPPLTPGDEAVDCDGQPDGADLLDVLHAADLLDADGDADVVEGPLCAGDWQYAVIIVPDRDPLQVITSGAPGDLTLVTAGTDVCTVEVRVRAPRGIRVAAACVS